MKNYIFKFTFIFRGSDLLPFVLSLHFKMLIFKYKNFKFHLNKTICTTVLKLKSEVVKSNASQTIELTTTKVIPAKQSCFVDNKTNTTNF